MPRPTLPAFRASLVALVVALAVTVLPFVAADAAGKRTQSYATKGLRASLTVDFKSRYEWTLQGWLKDVCPADGRGVYMGDPDGLVKTRNGWKVVVGWFGQGSDRNGCDNGRTNISQRRMVQTAPKKAFRALRIKVCAMDGGKSDPAPICYVRVWYNPYY